MISITADEFELLRNWIEQECGISLQANKQYLVESRFANLMAEHGYTTFKEFYQHAKNNPNAAFKDKIIDAITTNETLWFRDESPFITLQEKIFPEFAEHKKPCRIWSAACSTGQEPYSIAISAVEYAEKNHQKPWLSQLSIFASDISQSAIQIAESGRYNGLLISRGLPADYQQKYFEQDGSVYVLKDCIKQRVQFQKFNLQSSFLKLGKFDVIFLRNVAIYFSQDFKIQLFRKLAEALNPGGYLFIGASETLIGYSDDFEPLEHKRCRFYQVKKKGLL